MTGPKVFLDSDVLLDVFFEREEHFENSQKLLALIENHKIIGFTSSLVLANCHYILESTRNKSIAAKAIRKVRSILTVLPCTDKEIGQSLNSEFPDFEDGVQYFICVNNDLEVLVTRNTHDYKKAGIQVFSPQEYLKLSAVIEEMEKKE